MPDAIARSMVRCALITTGRSTILPFTAITPEPRCSASFIAARMVSDFWISFSFL